MYQLFYELLSCVDFGRWTVRGQCSEVFEWKSIWKYKRERTKTGFWKMTTKITPLHISTYALCVWSLLFCCITARQRHPGPYILRWRPHTCSTNITSTERTTTVQVCLPWVYFMCQRVREIVYRCFVTLWMLSLCLCLYWRSDFITITQTSLECSHPLSVYNFVSLPSSLPVSVTYHKSVKPLSEIFQISVPVFVS